MATQTKKPTTTEAQVPAANEPRALSAADFRPFFPESSGNCILLFGPNSLTITEDKGFKPTLVIPYTQEWLSFVSQKVLVTISDSFAKVDNPLETYTAKRTATTTGGYLLTCSLNGTLERSSTNFYAKQTGKTPEGKAKYGNKSETGLERVVAAMSGLDLSPATFGQERKQVFIFAKFVAWVDEQTKAGGSLNAKLDTWLATKKRYPTSRLLEAAVMKLMREHGTAYWLTASIIAAGYVEPAEIESESLADLL